MTESEPRGGRRHRAAAIGFLAFLVETVAVWRRTGKPGGNVVVRCRSGHLFTTLWIPGASVKSARFGPWRLQRCPVGGHFTIVTPVRESALTLWQRRSARSHRDIRVP